MKQVVKFFSSVLLFFAMIQISVAGPQEDLITACKQGNLDGVKAAISAGANVNQMDAAGQVPMGYAVMWPEVVTYLLDNGADPNQGNTSALYNAVVYYSVDVIKLLLAKGADVNKGTIIPGNAAVKIYQKLLDDEKAKGKKANKLMIKSYEDLIAQAGPATPDKTETPLQYAVANSNCVECVKLLLDAGAKTDVKDAENGNLIYSFASSAQEPKVRIDGWKSQHQTFETTYGMKLPDWFKNLDETRCGKAEDILMLILKKGLDVNDANTTYGFNALGRALYYKKISIAKVLLQNGADPKIPIKYHSGDKSLAEIFPICQAAEVGNLELMKLIVEKGADINTKAKGMSLMNVQNLTGGENYTPLNLSLGNKKPDIAAYLIEKGADINIGVEGYVAVRPQNIPDNVNLNCLVSVTKKTPIYWAIEAGSMEVVKLLAEKMLWKFNPDYTVKTLGGSVTSGAFTYECIKYKDQYNPSAWALEVGQKEIAGFLLSKGM
ncbi:MAG: ankyrin repeat domain-containing protein [Bacteroidales bacterium]|jgi:ankyrin repeat protein|nr:ankyrin repeat domain-containing protein [Bacteroidales bacterium]